MGVYQESPVVANAATPCVLKDQASPVSAQIVEEKREKVSEGFVDLYLYFLCPGENVYNALHIPKWLPPEAIVGIGYLCSFLAAVCFSYTAQSTAACVFAALFVYGNFVADYMDGRFSSSSLRPFRY
eukprot:Colp12_sorted_trinity150504_noHs@5745